MNRLLRTLPDAPDEYTQGSSRNWPDDDDDPSFEGPFGLILSDITTLEYDSAHAINSIYRDPFPKGRRLAARAKIARDFISDILFGEPASLPDGAPNEGVILKRVDMDDLGNIDDEFRQIPLMDDTILGLKGRDYIKRKPMRKALEAITNASSKDDKSRQVSAVGEVQPRGRVRTYIYKPINLFVIRAWIGLADYDPVHISTAETSDSLRGRCAPYSKTKPVETGTDGAPDMDSIGYQQQEIERFKDQISDDHIRFHIFPIYTPSAHGDDRWMMFIYDNRQTNRPSKHKSVSGRYQGRFLHVVGYEDDVNYTWTATFARAIERTLQPLHITTEVSEIRHIYPLSDNPAFYGSPACYSHTGPLVIYALTRALTLIEDVDQSNASFLRHATECLLRPDYEEALGINGWYRILRKQIKQLVQDSNPDDELRGERPNMPDTFYTMLYDFLDMYNRSGPTEAKGHKDKNCIRPRDVRDAMSNGADAYLIGQYKLADDKPDTNIRRFRGVPLKRGSVVFLEGPEETSDEYASAVIEVSDLLMARKGEMNSAYYRYGVKALNQTTRSILALFVDPDYETWIIANNCVRTSWSVNGHRVAMSDFMGPLPSVTYISNDDLRLADGKSTFQWIFLQRYDSEQDHLEFASFGKAPREVLQKNFGQLWSPRNRNVSKRENTHPWHHHHRPVAKEDKYLAHLWKLHTGNVVQCSNWRCYPNGVPACEGTIGDAEHPSNELFGSFAGSEFHGCRHGCPDLGHQNEGELNLPEGVVIYEPYLRNSRHLTICTGRVVDEGGRIEGRAELFHPPNSFMPIGFQAQDYWHGRDVNTKMANGGIQLYGDPQTGVLFDLRGIPNIRIKRQQLWNSLPKRRQAQIWSDDIDQAKDNRNTIIDPKSSGSWDPFPGLPPGLDVDSNMDIKYTDAVDLFFESELGVDNVVVDPESGRVDKVYNRRMYQRELYTRGEVFVRQDRMSGPRTMDDMEPCGMIPEYQIEDIENNDPDSINDGFETFPPEFQVRYNELLIKRIKQMWAHIKVVENARKDPSEKGGGLYDGKQSEVLNHFKQELLHKWDTLIGAQKWKETPVLDAALAGGAAGAAGAEGAEDDGLGLKRKHRHHFTILPQTHILDPNAAILKSTRADAENNFHPLDQDPLEVGDSKVLQKCIPKTSYYDENLLMEPEPVPNHFPSTVITERFVNTRSSDIDMSMSTDLCVKTIENRNQDGIVSAVAYPKREIVLVRDVDRDLSERSVHLKRQIEPDEDSSTEFPNKLRRLRRA